MLGTGGAGGLPRPSSDAGVCKGLDRKGLVTVGVTGVGGGEITCRRDSDRVTASSPPHRLGLHERDGVDALDQDPPGVGGARVGPELVHVHAEERHLPRRLDLERAGGEGEGNFTDNLQPIYSHFTARSARGSLSFHRCNSRHARSGGGSPVLHLKFRPTLVSLLLQRTAPRAAARPRFAAATRAAARSRFAAAAFYSRNSPTPRMARRTPLCRPWGPIAASPA